MIQAGWKLPDVPPADPGSSGGKLQQYTGHSINGSRIHGCSDALHKLECTENLDLPTYIRPCRDNVSRPANRSRGTEKSKHKDGRQVARGSKDPRDYFRDQRLRGNAPSRRGWLLAGTPAATRRSRLSWDSAPPTRVTEQRNSLGLMTSRLGAPASSVRMDQRRACQGPVRHSGAMCCTVTSQSAWPS